ncbi:hypothetical protein M406DRAFT_67284 [Cryphonectria parasitica EP155]|uniref:Uncharacterized protein n=1 Tax=Cryphonectria parasitica (strain ATCC 38755 / EP155) TaxID=660469 RepID=A0A9P5CUV3_CRYP1|nr:uncharacterized protein M406DRAFT_67284 [Cryphonectria parasitica EP155]KAF3770927.1 hypothetical protein M406DRAFT_67284 [Cryphonectria parasitica EP155]
MPILEDISVNVRVTCSSTRLQASNKSEEPVCSPAAIKLSSLKRTRNMDDDEDVYDEYDEYEDDEYEDDEDYEDYQQLLHDLADKFGSNMVDEDEEIGCEFPDMDNKEMPSDLATSFLDHDQVGEGKDAYVTNLEQAARYTDIFAEALEGLQDAWSIRSPKASSTLLSRTRSRILLCSSAVRRNALMIPWVLTKAWMATSRFLHFHS